MSIHIEYVFNLRDSIFNKICEVCMYWIHQLLRVGINICFWVNYWTKYYWWLISVPTRLISCPCVPWIFKINNRNSTVSIRILYSNVSIHHTPYCAYTKSEQTTNTVEMIPSKRLYFMIAVQIDNSESSTGTRYWTVLHSTVYCIRIIQ